MRAEFGLGRGQGWGPGKRSSGVIMIEEAAELRVALDAIRRHGTVGVGVIQRDTVFDSLVGPVKIMVPFDSFEHMPEMPLAE